MKLYEYKDHNDYVNEQTRANVSKLHKVWVSKQTIIIIKSLVNYAANIMCHGTRNGAEQKYFKEEYPQADIIGTEISYTATTFPMTLQHDFHDDKEEWFDKFDIVYSNSFDHSYDPIKSLGAWKKQINDEGRIFIELMTGDDQKSKSTDPLEITEDEFAGLCIDLDLEIESTHRTIGGDGRYSILYQLKK